MIFPPQIKADFAAAFGQEVRYPATFEALAESVYERTGQRVSVNTLKRLFGLIGPEVEPRRSTLDILAQYLGSADWTDYAARLYGAGNSDFEKDPRMIDTARLAVGASVSFRYHPDRRIRISHLGGGVFIVEESEHSKLIVGDRISVRSLCPGYPLSADYVIREGEDLGSFVAGTPVRSCRHCRV